MTEAMTDTCHTVYAYRNGVSTGYQTPITAWLVKHNEREGYLPVTWINLAGERQSTGVIARMLEGG